MKPKKLIKEMDKLGVTITRMERCKSGHHKCYLTNGRFIIASSSSSDHRSMKNLAACARKELNHNN